MRTGGKISTVSMHKIRNHGEPSQRACRSTGTEPTAQWTGTTKCQILSQARKSRSFLTRTSQWGFSRSDMRSKSLACELLPCAVSRTSRSKLRDKELGPGPVLLLKLHKLDAIHTLAPPCKQHVTCCCFVLENAEKLNADIGQTTLPTVLESANRKKEPQQSQHYEKYSVNNREAKARPRRDASGWNTADMTHNKRPLVKEAKAHRVLESRSESNWNAVARIEVSCKKPVQYHKGFLHGKNNFSEHCKMSRNLTWIKGSVQTLLSSFRPRTLDLLLLMDRCAPAQASQMTTSRFTDAHSGLAAPQSAQTLLLGLDHSRCATSL